MTDGPRTDAAGNAKMDKANDSPLNGDQSGRRVEIAADAEVITLINTFTCPEVRQRELVEALDRAVREVFVRLDGFVAAGLHASLDQTHVVNYVQWLSIDHFDRAQVHPEVRKHLDEVMSIAESADPRLYRVRAVHVG